MLTAAEWLAFGIALGSLATVVSILAAAELDRRRRRMEHRRRPPPADSEGGEAD